MFLCKFIYKYKNIVICTNKIFMHTLCMRTISQAVDYLLSQSPFLQQCILQDVANYSSIARKLMPDLRLLTPKRCTQAAVIMAIRKCAARYRAAIKVSKRPVLSAQSFSARSGLALYVLPSSPELCRAHARLLRQSKACRDPFLWTNFDTKHVIFVVDSQLQDFLLHCTQQQKAVATTASAAAIHIRVQRPEDSWRLQFCVLQSLILQGVDVLHCFAAHAEIVVICKDRQLDAACSAVRAVVQKPVWKFW